MIKTANQSIKPLTLKLNAEKKLEIGGCEIESLVSKYETPLYIYDEETIRTIAKQYQDALKKYPNHKLLFASKAFMVKAICKIMQEEGFGLDLVSGGEIFTANEAGFDMSQTLFNGNNKSIEELKMALEYGVGRFSVDNFLELSMLNELAKSKNKKVKILLRITPGIECHTHEYIKTGQFDSKFGFALTQIDKAIELINYEYENLDLKGLHAHIGSQIFETKVYYDEVQILLSEVKRIKDKFGIDLPELNLGGGLGITYTQNDTPPSVFEIIEVILTSLNEGLKKFNLKEPKIYLEPGRSMVGTAGITVYTVGSSKQVPNGKKYVALDGGMADNVRPSMYQAKYTAQKVSKNDEQEFETVTLAGKCCESGDILIENIELPILEEGDLICIYNTGAYGYSMSSNYNRLLKPAVVLVNSAQSAIIVQRESYEYLTQLDKIPNWLK